MPQSCIMFILEDSSIRQLLISLLWTSVKNEFICTENMAEGKSTVYILCFLTFRTFLTFSQQLFVFVKVVYLRVIPAALATTQVKVDLKSSDVMFFNSKLLCKNAPSSIVALQQTFSSATACFQEQSVFSPTAVCRTKFPYIIISSFRLITALWPDFIAHAQILYVKVKL